MIAKLVYNSNFTRTYGRYIELVNGTINQLILGGHHFARNIYRTTVTEAILELGRSAKSLGNASFQWHIFSVLVRVQLWPWLLVIACFFNGIIHSINGVFLVLITGIIRALTVSLGASKIIQQQFNVNKHQTINGCLTRRVPFKYQMKWLLEEYPPNFHKPWFSKFRGWHDKYVSSTMFQWGMRYAFRSCGFTISLLHYPCNVGPPSDVCWFRFAPATIAINAINHSEIGLMFTNLAIVNGGLTLWLLCWESNKNCGPRFYGMGPLQSEKHHHL